MASAAETGFLVLADISGFTAFVTATELEGDAVFAIGRDAVVRDGRILPVVLVNAFAAFTQEQRQMALDDRCSCGACRAVPSLDLKLVAHHGRFVRQTVGTRSRVAGPDVILVHRLLKNPVNGAADLLLTASALARVGRHPLVRNVRPLVARDAHFGEVPCFVAEIPRDGGDAGAVEPVKAYDDAHVRVAAAR